ncbi:hypothetical protein MKW92_011348 [Papaver armeniacum]|nr:hypothetical protein MKW92_011348 [Papaver armeniacum]
MEENQSNNPTETSDKPQDTTAQKKHAAMIEPIYLLLNPLNHLQIDFMNPNINQTEIDRCRLATDSESKANLKSDLDKLSILISELGETSSRKFILLPSMKCGPLLKPEHLIWKETLESVNYELLPRRNSHLGINLSPLKKNQGNVVRATENENSGFDSVRREGDFTLDLNSCEVRITGCFRALYIHRLRELSVYVGDLIHHAKKTDFYLRVRVGLRIEDCNSVRFAPICYSSLDEETGNWANVDDFKWLRAVQSPNWSILPEEERVSAVNI